MIGEKSFKREISVKDMFQTDQHKEALARLLYVIETKGLGLVTGEPGAGKSALTRALAHQLNPSRYILCYINNSMLAPKDLYSQVLIALSVEPYSFLTKMKRQFTEVVSDIYRSHQKQIVVIIDNAQALPPATLQEIRYMAAFEMDSFSPLSILLIGQQELWHTLRLRVFEPLFYSITSHFHLQSLSVKDTRAYIAHQLRLSNLDMLFPDDVVGKIHSYSKGLPRIINLICSHCLIDLEVNQMKLVDHNVLERVLSDLKFNSLSA